ncbi:MAG: helix-turn-helix transcriptional regulator [Candidatus Staskawiczbacteria bacterium]|nr:helix-turn-helix transcriptional regulator [Candidatus Staskawiczbacteria bacterium]
MNKKNIKQIKKEIDFQSFLEEQLKDPESRRLFDEYGRQLEIAYQILQLRKEKKLSQAQLAKKIGTKQSNIARMESGQQNFSVEILEKIADAFGCNLKIIFCK